LQNKKKKPQGGEVNVNPKKGKDSGGSHDGTQVYKISLNHQQEEEKKDILVDR